MIQSHPISAHQSQTLKTYAILMRSTNAVTTALHRHLVAHHLTLSQFGVLEALYHLGPLCQRDIGQKILKTSGNITLVIDNLEKRGLVRRRRNRPDRRYVQVDLSADGKALIHSILPWHAETAEQIFAVLDENQLETLRHLLKILGTQNFEV